MPYARPTTAAAKLAGVTTRGAFTTNVFPENACFVSAPTACRFVSASVEVPSVIDAATFV
jgi:hypothetical protein